VTFEAVDHILEHLSFQPVVNCSPFPRNQSILEQERFERMPVNLWSRGGLAHHGLVTTEARGPRADGTKESGIGEQINSQEIHHQPW
jgi:hypothetical protein